MLTHLFFIIILSFGFSQTRILRFDGIDDYVQLPDMGGYTDDFTI